MIDSERHALLILTTDEQEQEVELIREHFLRDKSPLVVRSMAGWLPVKTRANPWGVIQIQRLPEVAHDFAIVARPGKCVEIDGGVEIEFLAEGWHVV